jgi:anaerobic selenocysteine-containing dehydrogenase
VIDHFLTDTARHADIVLPATTQFEHFDIQGGWGHHYVMANNPAIPPQGEARSGGAIMRGLAARLGLDHHAFRESDEEIAASALPEGWKLADLAERGWRKSPPPRPAIQPLASKLKIAGGPIAELDHPPTDHLQLLNPKSHYFLNSTFANMQRHQYQQGRPVITLNGDDAKARGLEDGMRVAVRNGAAELRLTLAVSDSVRRGVATFEGKWWDGGESQATPLNRLTASCWSPAGQPAYNEVFVTVTAAN